MDKTIEKIIDVAVDNWLIIKTSVEDIDGNSILLNKNIIKDTFCEIDNWIFIFYFWWENYQGNDIIGYQYFFEINIIELITSKEFIEAIAKYIIRNHFEYDSSWYEERGSRQALYLEKRELFDDMLEVHIEELNVFWDDIDLWRVEYKWIDEDTKEEILDYSWIRTISKKWLEEFSKILAMQTALCILNNDLERFYLSILK